MSSKTAVCFPKSWEPLPSNINVLGLLMSNSQAGESDIGLRVPTLIKFVFILSAPEFVEHVYGCYLKLFWGTLVIFISLSSYNVLSCAFI